MDPAKWQRALRQQFGREQAFTLQALGPGPVFGDYRVDNPGSRSSYRVAIRGLAAGDNFCTCADYATNGLGTCKHIEFALHKLQNRRGARSALRLGYQPAFSELWLHYGEQRSVHWRAGAQCPARLQALAAGLFDLVDGARLPHDKLLQLDEFIHRARKLADSLGHELQVHEDVLAFSAQARDADRRLHTLMAAYPKGVADKRLAKLLKTQLYPYQIEGALFAARVGRALIGDDMGLGKTVQAIAATELMARHFGVRRVLVVCPTSLKHQWQLEIKRFSGRDAQVLGGLRTARQTQWREESFCKIVNYEALVRDADLVEAWAPELLIVDEAQRVKNWNTQAARAIKRIAAPTVCPHVIVLTGTPLENRLEELVSIVQIVDQHRLGPTWRFLHDHQQTDETGRVTGYHDLDRIGTKLAPILLRRRKSEVLTQLPERVDKTLFVPLTPEQRVHHDENGLVVTRIVQRWRKTGYLSDIDQRRLQCALQNMRMACNSTWLLDHETDHGSKADELVTVLEELFEDPQAKAVVFSQWLGTHEVLMKRLALRGWNHVFFHGSVPAEQRGALVQRFHDDASCRLFLSTDAGGTGLNLQHAAAVVVNMDMPWNPAILEQRIGRVHRMGQRRGVQVINMVAEGSIEEGMLSVLSFKKSLFSGVLDGGASDVFMEGSRLSRFMESVDKVTEGIVMPDTASPAACSEADPTDDIPIPLAETSGHEPRTPQSASEAPHPAGSKTLTAQDNPWTPLLQAGVQLLQSLAAPGGNASGDPAVHTDAATGERYLKLPVPDPGMLRHLAELLQALGTHTPS
jgi:superfamily II DNA or RNA helicase